MIGAALTAVFFGITPVCAGRAIALIGFVRANLLRLAIALVVMGAWALTFGKGWTGLPWFFATAGAIGFGLGGLALLASLPRLGAPLASLIEESGAAVVAAAVAWLWYADKLTANQAAFCGVILAGVFIGLWPYLRGASPAGIRLGIALALLAAVAQGISFAMTRRGLLLMKQDHLAPDTITVAFQRLAGGLLVAIAVFVVARWVWHRRWGFAGQDGQTRGVIGSAGGSGGSPSADGRLASLAARPLYWAGLNSLFGPILGVTCTVWAQQSLNPGVVQAVAAMAPLISVPFARRLQGHKPPAGWYLGAGVAIAGLVLLFVAV